MDDETTIPPLRTILFACDPAGLNLKARRYAIDIARRYNAGIVLVLASELPEDSLILFRKRLLPTEQLEKQVVETEAELRPELDAIAEAFVDEGITVRSVVATDKRIGEAILRTAEENDVDLLVLGSRGHGAVMSLLVGSVTDYVLHNTTRPLLIVPDDGSEKSDRSAQEKEKDTASAEADED